MKAETARPTAEFGRHHAVEAPLVDSHQRRAHWTVQDRFKRLHDAGRVSEEAYSAGCRWREDMERVTSLSPPAFGTVRIPTGSREPWQGQIDASARLRIANGLVGALGLALLSAVILQDRSWRSLARNHGRAALGLQLHFIGAVEALAKNPPYGALP